MAKKLLKITTLLSVLLMVFLLTGCPKPPVVDPVIGTISVVPNPVNEGETFVVSVQVQNATAVSFMLGTTTPVTPEKSGNTCSYTFTAWEVEADTDVTITVSATNAPEGKTPKTVSKTATVTIKNVPEPEEFTLTITKVGQGTVTPASGTTYASGTVVDLAAVPAEGWQFVNWVGDVADVNDPTTTVTMNEDKTVQAVFQEIPVGDFTLTIVKTGQGTVTPASGTMYASGTVVPLVATEAEGWDFVKWVVDGVEVFTATTSVTMNEDKTVQVFFEEEPGPEPRIINLSLTTNDFMVLQPCTANLEVRFQVKVDANVNIPVSELVAAEYSVTHVTSGLSYTVTIPEVNWGAPWTYTVSETNLKNKIANPIPGGLYEITVTATNAAGNAASDSEFFYVKNYVATSLEAEIVNDPLDQITRTDGICIVGTGLPATIEATISYDSKITARVYLVDTMYTGTLNEMIVEGDLIVEEVFMTESLTTESVMLALPDLRPLMDAGQEYNLVVLLFTPECGALGCVDCGIEAWTIIDCDLIKDTEPEIECIPCECQGPCDPCFKGYNPGIAISNLLSTDPDYFDIVLTINDSVFTNEDFTFVEDEDTLEVRILIEEGMVTPELSGTAVLHWTVVTPTGVELEATCTEGIDFIPPVVDIDIEDCCINIEEITQTTFTVTFSDNVGLRRGKIWVTGATIQLPAGKTPGSWFTLSGTETTVEGTVTLTGDEYTLYATGEDVFCITTTASQTCGINTPPLVDFGPCCDFFSCPPECYVDEIELCWGIVDLEDNFTYFEIEVSHGAVDTYDPEQLEGSVTWDLGAVDCEFVTATITAYDDCGEVSSSKVKSWTSPYPMDNVVPEVDLTFAECGEPEECATFTVLAWDAFDACLEGVEICVEQGYLVDPDTGATSTCWATDTAMGEITWEFEEMVDCENLFAFIWAWDTCENEGYDELISENVIDNMAPDVFLGIWGIGSTVPGDPGEIGDDFIDAECTDATCLVLVWVVEENCLDDVWLTTNYPLNPCGTTIMERPKGNYIYDPREMNPWWTEIEDLETGRTVTIGVIRYCMPLIDCDTFEATLTADDISECTGEVSDFASITIDNKVPEVTLDWTLDEISSCATEATLTWSITDGSFPCEGCFEGCCEIGYLDLYLEGLYFGGTGIMVCDDEATYTYFEPGWEIEYDSVTMTYSGTVTYSEEEGSLDCVLVEVELGAYGCCCGVDNEGIAPVTEWLSTIVDNVAPELEVDLPDLDPVELKYCRDQVIVTQDEVTIEATATDGCFDELVVEVSHGLLPNGSTVWATDVEGFHSLLWDLSVITGIDCTDVTLTVTAYDTFGCEDTVYATTFVIDTQAPEIDFTSDSETCGATQVILDYCLDDDCLTCGDCTTMMVGRIYLSVPMDSGPYAGMSVVPITATCNCVIPLCGTVVWTLPDVDCGETLVATLVAWDTSGNVSSKTIEIDDIDNQPPVVNDFSVVTTPSATSVDLSWDATDNCFDSVAIYVSHGNLPDISPSPAAFEAAAYVPTVFSDMGISFTPVGTTTWDLTGICAPNGTTVTATLIAYDLCCNETVVATSFQWFCETPEP